MRRVLVVRRGALGDSLCFLPILDAVAQSWPAAEIHFAGEDAIATLFAERGAATHGMSSEDLGLWRLRGAEPSRCACRRLLASYDRLVGDLDAEALPAELANRTTAFEVVADEASDEAASLQLLARASRVWPVAWPAPSPVPRLSRRSSVRVARRLWVHPGSGSPRKNWSGFAPLLDRAAAAGWDLVVSFGEADVEVQSRLAPALPAGTLRCDRRPLHEVAGRLEQAAVYLGNDSGMSHLAAALAVPTLVLFGPSRPEVWKPLGEHVEAIRFADAKPAMVWDRICALASRA